MVQLIQHLTQHLQDITGTAGTLQDLNLVVARNKSNN
jgi:hypothetical protein